MKRLWWWSSRGLGGCWRGGLLLGFKRPLSYRGFQKHASCLGLVQSIPESKPSHSTREVQNKGFALTFHGDPKLPPYPGLSSPFSLRYFLLIRTAPRAPHLYQAHPAPRFIHAPLPPGIPLDSPTSMWSLTPVAPALVCKWHLYKSSLRDSCYVRQTQVAAGEHPPPGQGLD